MRHTMQRQALQTGHFVKRNPRPGPARASPVHAAGPLLEHVLVLLREGEQGVEQGPAGGRWVVGGAGDPGVGFHTVAVTACECCVKALLRRSIDYEHSWQCGCAERALRLAGLVS